MTFGEKVQALRRKEGWTQEGLASRIGVSRQALGKWEQGTAVPDVENVLELAKLFHVTTDYLLMDELEAPQEPQAPAEAAEPIQKDSVLWPIFGGITSLLGAVGILVLKIYSSIHPAYFSSVTTFDGEFIPARTGLSPYLEIHNLTWLFWLCLVLVAFGIFLCFCPRIARRCNTWFNKE